MEKYILKSKSENFEPIKEKTFPEYCLMKARFYADQGKDFWMVDGFTDEKRYFNTFDHETRQVGSAFWKMGLRKGDTVIYMIKDLFKLPVLLVGVLRANGVLRASYPEDDIETISSRVKESNCKFIVCEEDAVETCKQVAGNVGWELEIITVNRTDSTLTSLQQILVDDNGLNCPPILVTEDDPAIILCTSGTTGLPKGALHTHQSLVNQTRSLRRLRLSEKKLNLIATKATHISGTFFPITFMTAGKPCIVVSNPSTDTIFKTALKYKPGYIFAFSSFLIAMAEAQEKGDMDFSSIDIIFTGGVQLTPAFRQTLKKLPNLKDLIIIYGMTESLVCATNSVLRQLSENEPASIRDIPDFAVGMPGPMVDLKIRDPDTMAVLGPNETGEICVKSPGLFHSYYLNLEATKSAVEDGYFRTGDIGYYDENGFVYIVDRLKEIFKYYGDHISPSELEGVIAKHPKVSEVCVVGVADAGGHIPRAFVTLQANSGSEKDVAVEIREYANGKLAHYKHLRGGVYIVKNLLLGKTGKVSRQLVHKIYVDEKF